MGITSSLLHYNTTITSTLSLPAIMQQVFLVVFVLVVSASAQLGKCPYWQAAHGNPNTVRDQQQDVLSDGSLSGSSKILTNDLQVLETLTYTSEKQQTTKTSLSGPTARGPCPYWENFYGGAGVLRSHSLYTHGGATIGEFKLLVPTEGTIQTIKYTLA